MFRQTVLFSVIAFSLGLPCLSNLQADEILITDGTATFRYDSDAPFGNNADLTSTLSGDTLFQETWFFRYNDPFAGLKIVELENGIASVNGNHGSLLYSGIGSGSGNNGFDITLEYLVEDVGGLPSLRYAASITNHNASSEDVAIFNYFDYDLNGAALDSATFSAGAPFDTLNVTDVGGLEATRLFAPVTHFQVEAWSNDLDGDLRSGAIMDLSDTGSPFGPGDFTAAVQWDLTIGAGQTGKINNRMSIPEPSSAAALIGLGLLGLMIGRRNP